MPPWAIHFGALECTVEGNFEQCLFEDCFQATKASKSQRECPETVVFLWLLDSSQEFAQSVHELTENGQWVRAGRRFFNL